MIDFETRLKSLKERRQGSRERAIFDSMDYFTANQAILRGEDVRRSEDFELLKESAGVKYAIGAMAAVDEAATRLSIREGERVADSLIKGLSDIGEYATKKLQGSVALNIHIKGRSDVDMLIIAQGTVNVELPIVAPSPYLPATDTRSIIEIVSDIRLNSEKILPQKFPKAEIDCSNNKAISISGGSLAREVDIVPAIWFDTTKYQQSRSEHDRGVKIYHKNDNNLILNLPFTHIKLINEKDSQYDGNLKNVIRLMKNMIADMPEYKRKIVCNLSSYDLASIAYHMNGSLYIPYYMKLSLVEKTRIHLENLRINDAYRSSLATPDQSRKIFNAENKSEALAILSKEMDDLAVSISQQLQPLRSSYDASAIMEKAIF